MVPNEALLQQLTKRIGNSRPEDIRRILQVADQLRRRIPVDRYDFDAAKAAVIAATEL